MSDNSMYLTAQDLMEQGMHVETPVSGFRPLGELTPGVDYYHPVGLRIKYAFTRAANKAPIPTEKPQAGYWYVLQQLPTGVWYYDLQQKKGATEAEAAASADAKSAEKTVTAAPAKAIATAAAPTMGPVASTKPKTATMVYVAAGAGVIALIGVVALILRKR
jgi:hypothetical protein